MNNNIENVEICEEIEEAISEMDEGIAGMRDYYFKLFVDEKIKHRTMVYMYYIFVRLKELKAKNYREKAVSIIEDIFNDRYNNMDVIEYVYNKKLVSQYNGFSNEDLLKTGIYVLWSMQHPEFEKYNKDVLLNLVILDRDEECCGDINPLRYSRENAICVKKKQRPMILEFLEENKKQFSTEESNSLSL